MGIASKIVKAAKPRERNIRADLKKRVEEYGGTVHAVKFLDADGCPDVLCEFPEAVRTPGRAVWVETKMGKDGRLSRGQQREIDLLRRCGQEVHVITNHAQLDAWLPELPF